MTRKVALIKFTSGYVDYDDFVDNIVQSISEWEEIDDDKYKMLKDAADFARQSNLADGYQIIEQLSTDSLPVLRTVTKYIEHVENERMRLLAEKEAKTQKAQERALAKIAKDKESRRKLLEQLQQEFKEE